MAQADEVRTAVFKKLYPVEFLKRHLEEHVREDGRGLLDPREATVATGVISQARGSALVRLGNGTMAIAAVNAHISEPQQVRPCEGYVVPSIDLSPIASPQYKIGPPGDDVQALTRRLQKFIDDTRVVPRESLEIAQGAAVWCLYVDVVFLSADGGLLDAAALAAVAALKNTTLPKATFDTDTRRCICDDTKEPLKLTCLPIHTTFGVCDSTFLLADPSAFEESLLSAKIEIGIGLDDVSYLLQTGNCTALDFDTQRRISNAELLEHCVTQSQSRAAALRRLL
ncbi:hypothetical protein MCUN1_001386 [Malassezia cuniculi]|uniref:Ribosomal RNA-processing protein 43 n=1 Tax=Malassezia cuniculi TaxID=948313 RepID=A0AAF0J5Z0_9BASI|nr:hypothetical protein MCUN1_001386 [Malassezia cuniculi]